MQSADPPSAQLSLTWLDAAGLLGVALLLAAYAGTVTGRVAATRPAALAVNLAGSLLILASLRGTFNLPSAVVEIAWASVAAVGLIRHARR
ncbi:CBU_0592 family membrane protein [Sphingomonas bacterium]|uniref:CBU_0592 family membrane protein n=1 Tax=Sphingomonas bacterium TaxID=1895847 RepID=UPI0015760621|nr:hypothetical protein [Sphingomonas bacterium]